MYIDGTDKIIYATSYHVNNKNCSGIFEYDIKKDEIKTIKLWSNIDYYPHGTGTPLYL